MRRADGERNVVLDQPARHLHCVGIGGRAVVERRQQMAMRIDQRVAPRRRGGASHDAHITPSSSIAMYALGKPVNDSRDSASRTTTVSTARASQPLLSPARIAARASWTMRPK